MTGRLRVRGNATAEELAVVVALVSHVEGGAPPDPYAQWRLSRLAALRPGRAGDDQCAR